MLSNNMFLGQNEVVPGEGLEPSRPFGQRILSPLRLPFRHPGRYVRPLLYIKLPEFP